MNRYIKIILILQKKLPNLLAIKLIQDYLFYVKCIDCKRLINRIYSEKCSICNNYLCNDDLVFSLKCGKYYTNLDDYKLCEKCCWLRV